VNVKKEPLTDGNSSLFLPMGSQHKWPWQITIAARSNLTLWLKKIRIEAVLLPFTSLRIPAAWHARYIPQTLAQGPTENVTRLSLWKVDGTPGLKFKPDPQKAKGWSGRFNS